VITEGTIAKLDVQDGDVLVLKSSAFISPNGQRNLREEMFKLFPHNTCIVLDGGIDLEVVRAQQAEATVP